MFEFLGMFLVAGIFGGLISSIMGRLFGENDTTIEYFSAHMWSIILYSSVIAILWVGRKG